MDVGFWITMLFWELLIPLLMLGFGLLFCKRPPQDIDFIFGYRTTLSMKNKDTWDFAQRMMGRLWWRIGLALLVLTVGGMLACLFAFARDEDTVGTYSLVFLYIQMAALLLSIWPVERALRRTFDADGVRREQKE
jgi:uncharacterized membrane protein